jgi:mono/diheme cytochrome c family protein
MAKYRGVWVAAGLTALSLLASSFKATPLISRQTGISTDSRVAAMHATLTQYCTTCHNEKAKTGGLVLSTLDLAHPEANPEIWEKVIRKLRARYMPPVGRPHPDEAAYTSLISYLESSLDSASAAHPNPGRTDSFHRLNRTEYQNAVRDLLALDIDAALLLPKDDASHGFDNVDVGGISPTLLDRYVSAAQKVSRLAVGSPVHSPAAEVVVIPPDLTQEEHFENLPFGTRGGTVVQHNFQQDGEYEIQLRLTRDRNGSIEGLSEPYQLEVVLDGVGVQVFDIKPQTKGDGPKPDQPLSVQDLADAGLHLRTAVKAGPHVVGATFLKNPSALLETERQPYQAHFNYDRHPRPQPALYSLSVVGPFNATGVSDTPSRKHIFVCHPARTSEEITCAKTILSALARRAYRRPLTDADLESLVGFYKMGAADGGFEAGVELALRSILVNPGFLLRVETDPANIGPNTGYRISDLELASRLSFFLWSSIPDDELLNVAVRGKLHEPAVLKQQTVRMLADPRSEEFTQNFADQWLYLRNLAASSPDPRLFPDFDDNLRQSLRRETELFFDSVVRDDRSVLDLLSANYTFLNERLAKHYGIPDVYGSRFRRVMFDKDSARRGLLGQGSILTVTSYGNRTSPVLRGKWVLDNLLGSAPPPPPANVPPLKETSGGSKPLSIRERMAEHRANPVCASCHQLMDPIGFSTENFDAVGRWRARDEGQNAIDASGTLPDGTAYIGIDGLREAILKRPELFVSTLTEKMLTYALGRGLEYYDATAVRAIVRNAGDHQYQFSSLVQGIVSSTPFLMRRSQ